MQPDVISYRLQNYVPLIVVATKTNGVVMMTNGGSLHGSYFSDRWCIAF